MLFISKKKHWARNEYQADKTFQTVEEAKEFGYIQQGTQFKDSTIEDIEKKDNYHEMGDEHDGTIYGNGNDKYIWLVPNTKESCELIFDKEGKLVTDCVNLGTYNFYHDDGTLWGLIRHAIVDVIPYYFWGNNKEDKETTSFWNRVKGNYTGDIPE